MLQITELVQDMMKWLDSFNGHPPLGVNATRVVRNHARRRSALRFNGHPPLGVNATV